MHIGKSSLKCDIENVGSVYIVKENAQGVVVATASRQKMMYGNTKRERCSYGGQLKILEFLGSQFQTHVGYHPFSRSDSCVLTKLHSRNRLDCR